MIPGTIWFDPNFLFSDGIGGRKLFVVLTNGDRDHSLVAKLTTNQRFYSLNQDANSEGILVFLSPKGHLV